MYKNKNVKDLNLNNLTVMELKDLRRKITFILEDKCYESNQKFLAKLKR
tara:strand:+ start:1872 stop:2018 length:147 start_codon:yes stop_codon:yes gene_type:complete